MGIPASDRPPIGILIMDDAVFSRHCLRALLDELPGVEATSSAASLAEARAFLVECGADLVLVSPHQLDPSGASTVRAVRQLVPSARVVVVGSSLITGRGAESLGSGADAVVESSNVFQRVCDLLSEWFGVDTGTDIRRNSTKSGGGKTG